MCVCVCACVCVCVCVHGGLHVCVHVCMCVCVGGWACVCMHGGCACMCAFMSHLDPSICQGQCVSGTLLSVTQWGDLLHLLLLRSVMGNGLYRGRQITDRRWQAPCLVLFIHNVTCSWTVNQTFISDQFCFPPHTLGCSVSVNELFGSPRLF